MQEVVRGDGALIATDCALERCMCTATSGDLSMWHRSADSHDHGLQADGKLELSELTAVGPLDG